MSGREDDSHGKRSPTPISHVDDDRLGDGSVPVGKDSEDDSLVKRSVPVVNDMCEKETVAPISDVESDSFSETGVPVASDNKDDGPDITSVHLTNDACRWDDVSLEMTCDEDASCDDTISDPVGTSVHVNNDAGVSNGDISTIPAVTEEDFNMTSRADGKTVGVPYEPEAEMSVSSDTLNQLQNSGKCKKVNRWMQNPDRHCIVCCETFQIRRGGYKRAKFISSDKSPWEIIKTFWEWDGHGIGYIRGCFICDRCNSHLNKIQRADAKQVEHMEHFETKLQFSPIKEILKGRRVTEQNSTALWGSRTTIHTADTHTQKIPSVNTQAQEERITMQVQSAKKIQFCNQCGSLPLREVKGQLEKICNQLEVLLPNTCVICYCPLQGNENITKEGQRADESVEQNETGRNIHQESDKSELSGPSAMEVQSVFGAVQPNKTVREISQESEQSGSNGQKKEQQITSDVIKQNETSRDVQESLQSEQSVQTKKGQSAFANAIIKQKIGKEIYHENKPTRQTKQKQRTVETFSQNKTGRRIRQDKSKPTGVVKKRTNLSVSRSGRVRKTTSKYADDWITQQFTSGTAVTAPKFHLEKSTLPKRTTQDLCSGNVREGDKASSCGEEADTSFGDTTQEYVKEKVTEPGVITDLPYQCKFCQQCFQMDQDCRLHVMNHIQTQNKQEWFDANIKPSLEVFMEVPLKRQRQSVKRDVLHYNDLKDLTPEIVQMLGRPLRDTNMCRCLQCDKEFASTVSMFTHMSDSHGFKKTDKRWQCRWCQKKFHARYNLKKHYCILMPGERKVVCEHCGKKFVTEAQMEKHNYLAHKRPHPGCSICGQKFYSKERLKSHIQKDHYKTKPFPCRYCPQSWYTERKRKRHEDNRHHGKKRYVCEVCGAAVNDLKKHSGKHLKVRNYACKQCPYKAKQLIDLKSHVSRSHEKIVEGPRKDAVTVLRKGVVTVTWKVVCDCRKTENKDELPQSDELKEVESDLVPKYIIGPGEDTMLLGGMPGYQRSVKWYCNILENAKCNNRQSAQEAGQRLCWALLKDEVSELTWITHNLSGFTYTYAGSKSTKRKEPVPQIDSGLLDAIYQQAKLQFADFPCKHGTDIVCKTRLFLMRKYHLTRQYRKSKYGMKKSTLGPT
ncbi:uncharacterized protein [Amphiura filiformis]|uniref:uncharacterized protein n=1 Tax=Amphiura filiformis TaxID=82378 RepID=UPI003B221361